VQGQAQFAGDDARDVEQVFDQLKRTWALRSMTLCARSRRASSTCPPRRMRAHLQMARGPLLRRAEVAMRPGACNGFRNCLRVHATATLLARSRQYPMLARLRTREFL
jgi:hypothetical protein